MYFTHSDAVWNVHPNLYALTIVANNVRAMKNDPARIEQLTAAVDKRLAAGSEAEMPEIAAWRDAFSKMGMKPTQYRCASEALLRRYRKERSMPSFHPLVDYLNFASMAYGIPIAAYDCRKISGGITVGPASGSESYITFQGETEHPEPNETIFADEEGNTPAAGRTARAQSPSSHRTRTACSSSPRHCTPALCATFRRSSTSCRRGWPGRACRSPRQRCSARPSVGSNSHPPLCSGGLQPAGRLKPAATQKHSPRIIGP